MRTLTSIALCFALVACVSGADDQRLEQSVQVYAPEGHGDREEMIAMHGARVPRPGHFVAPTHHVRSQLGPKQIPTEINPYFTWNGDEPSEDPESAEATSTPTGSFDLEPDVWNPNAFKRPRRRMSIAQLDQAIRDATGGIGWDYQGWPYTTQFAPLLATLGVPDWISRVVPDLTPNLVFQKFLNDAANDVCVVLINQEWSLPVEQRVFLVDIDPSQMPHLNTAEADANMQMLLLRFHGRHVLTSDNEMTLWRDLVTSTSLVTGDAQEAWRAVCIALLTHPHFFSY